MRESGVKVKQVPLDDDDELRRSKIFRLWVLFYGRNLFSARMYHVCEKYLQTEILNM